MPPLLRLTATVRRASRRRSVYQHDTQFGLGAAAVSLSQLSLFLFIVSEQLDSILHEVEDKSFGNDVYKITFQDKGEWPAYGYRYWFYLQDAMENVLE